MIVKYFKIDLYIYDVFKAFKNICLREAAKKTLLHKVTFQRNHTSRKNEIQRYKKSLTYYM